MTECLVLADLHINDWRSDPPGVRLSYYLKLGEIVRDKAIELGSPWIFLAGDILDKPVAPPHVIDTLRQFIVLLSMSGAKIGVILGQHDQNTRDLSDLRDTYLGIFIKDGFIEYLHKKTLLIEGLTLYFEDYTRDREVVPERFSDVYISHVTLGYQKVDNTRFKLGVFGDIHEPVDLGNMHSICPPICNHAHEYHPGVIGILHLSNGTMPEFTRWIYDPTFDIFPELIYIPRTLRDMSERVQTTITDTDICSLIHEEVHKYRVEDLFREIDIGDIPEMITSDYHLVELKVHDFKSIHDLTLNFDQLGRVLFISGDNGSGKTSVIEALFIALGGDRRLVNNWQTIGEDKEISLEVTITYHGSTYIIARGSKETRLWVDNHEIVKSNKTTLERYIQDQLPFLELLDYFYIRTYSHFFDHNRVDLINRFFNLQIFDCYYHKAKDLSKKYQQELKDLEDKLLILQGEQDREQQNFDLYTLDLRRFEDVEVSEEESLEGLKKSRIDSDHKIGILQNDLLRSGQRLESLMSTLDASEGGDLGDIELKIDKVRRLEELTRDLRISEQTRRSYETLAEGVQSITCPNCGTKIQVSGRDREELTSLITEVEDQIRILRGELESLKEYNSLSLTDLLHQKRDLEGKSQREEQCLELRRYISEVNSELSVLQERVSRLPQLEEIESSLRSIYKKQMIQDSLSRAQANLSTIQTRIRDLTSVKEETSKRVTQCEELIRIFDIKNLSSLPYQVLVLISDCLSTDTIQFKTFTSLSNGDLRLEVSCKLKVGSEYIDYDRCSQGQKTLLDLHILSRFLSLLGTVGVLALDESLSVLSQDYYDTACELIRGLPIDKILITSHQLGFSDYDDELICELQGGVTRWNLT